MFFFVDYKGGLVFVDCVSLLYCVGIVIDLNEYFVCCVFVSFWVELYYWEYLFNWKKVKDIFELECVGDLQVLFVLVFVIDEFVVFVKEVFEFVDGVIDIVQCGWFFGIYFIMVMQ